MVAKAGQFTTLFPTLPYGASVGFALKHVPKSSKLFFFFPFKNTWIVRTAYGGMHGRVPVVYARTLIDGLRSLPQEYCTVSRLRDGILRTQRPAGG